jgi:hypothetical protein
MRQVRNIKRLIVISQLNLLNFKTTVVQKPVVCEEVGCWQKLIAKPKHLRVFRACKFHILGDISEMQDEGLTLAVDDRVQSNLSLVQYHLNLAVRGT